MRRPIAFKKGTEEYDRDLSENPYPTWQKLEEMVEKGKIRNLGLSKYVLWLLSITATDHNLQ
jgi:diketogulonate reductase-like aldo/keto reductase